MMLAGYFGLFLMAVAFLAIGTLISSFTDNVVVAYVGTLFALLVLYTIGWLGETLTGFWGSVAALHLGHRPLPGAHQGSHRHQEPGVLRHHPDRLPLPDPSVGRIGALEVGRAEVGLDLRPARPALPRLRLRRDRVRHVALDGPVRAAERRPWRAPAAALPGVRPRQPAHAGRVRGSPATAPAPSSTRCFSSPSSWRLNYLGTRYRKHWDLTEASVYTLSPQSQKVANALTEKLVLTAFAEGGTDPQLDIVLDGYRDAGPGRVETRILDPDKEPGARRADEDHHRAERAHPVRQGVVRGDEADRGDDHQRRSSGSRGRARRSSTSPRASASRRSLAPKTRRASAASSSPSSRRTTR